MSAPDEKKKSTNVTWHDGHVTRAARQALFGHHSATLWFTGLSGSGKSTLARAVERALTGRGAHAYVLDGDNLRHGLNGDLGFTADDRKENIRRVGEVAKLLNDSGLIVLTAFISPYVADRATARALHDDSDLAFLEVHVNVSIEEAERRDPKGLYKRARAGEIKDFTGISAPYEPPTNPEIKVSTEHHDLLTSVDQVITALEQRGLLPKTPPVS